MNKLNNQTKGVILLIILILGGIGLYYFFVVRDENVEIFEDQEERNVLIPYEENKQTANVIEENKNQIVIDIAGEVKKPGVFELDEGCRIKDAIEIAGGLTKNADTSDMNLAYKLEDGMKIKVPSIKKNETVSEISSESYVSTETGSGVKTTETTNTNNSNTTKTTNQIVNINTASQKELETLPGVGSATANKIIQYREEKGKFKKKEDIKNVSRYWRQ